jgi:hypothetical protein
LTFSKYSILPICYFVNRQFCQLAFCQKAILSTLNFNFKIAIWKSGIFTKCQVDKIVSFKQFLSSEGTAWIQTVNLTNASWLYYHFATGVQG